MSCNKVPEYNVTPDKILDVLGDSALKHYISNRNILLTPVFKSPNINGNYIDPSWCSGSNSDERFTELSIDDPISCYNYILYGGCDDVLPEIHFSNILDSKDIDHVNDVNITEDDNILNLWIQPDADIIKPYFNPTLPTSPYDVSGRYRDFLNRTDGVEYERKVRSKVKVVHKNQIKDNVSFRIKITGWLANEKIDERYVYSDGTNTYNIAPVLVGTAITGDITSQVIQDVINGADIYLDYLPGPEDPFYDEWVKLKSFIDSSDVAYTIFEVLSMIAVLISLILLADTIWDMFTNDSKPANGLHSYKMLTNGVYNRYDVRMSEVNYKVGSKISNNYIKESNHIIKDDDFYSNSAYIDKPDFYIPYIVNIDNFSNNSYWNADSSWSINSGNAVKIETLESSINSYITINKDQYYKLNYSVTNLDNNGTLSFNPLSIFKDNEDLIIIDLQNNKASGNVEVRGHAKDSIVNVIFQADSLFNGYISNLSISVLNIEYPANTYISNSNYKSNYIDLDFKPIGNRYDPATPLPGTTYVVELEAISNCVLSKTKPTKFIITTFPDRMSTPKFDIEPSRIYRNTIVKFSNALYCDFIGCADQDPIAAFEFLGGDFFEKYYDLYINTNGNKPGTQWSYPLEFTGSHIVNNGGTAFAINGYHWGFYRVYFMKEQEHYSQKIKNYSFVGRSGSYHPIYQDTITYWNLGEDWQIKSGACRRIGVGNSEFYQEGIITPPVNWPAMYNIKVYIANSTKGTVYIECANNFRYDIYSPYDPDLLHPEPTQDYEGEVAIDGSRVKFLGNGKHNIALRANNTVDGTFRIGSTPDFNGDITLVKVNRMDPGNKGIERAVPLYSELVQVYNDYEDTILKLWFEAKDASLFGESNQNNTIDLSIGSFSIPVNIEMQTEIGAITYYNNVTDILNISHKYFSNGIKPIIIRIKPILTEIDNYTFSSLQINSFTCNNSNLYGVDTEQAIFLDAIIDLSNCNLGKKFLTRTRNDGSVSNRSVHNNNSFWGVSELNISDNPTLDVDISEFNTIKHKLYANNTPLQGDLASISVISELELINTNVYFYSSVPYIRCLNIKWYNSNTNILVNSLNDLIRDLYEGSLNNGTLYIAGDNPDIEDEQILYYIFKLVHDRFWTIIYNGYYVTSENEANYLQTGEDNYIYTK